MEETAKQETLSTPSESEANLRSLLENASNFVVYRVAIDPENLYGGKVVMVSPSITDLVGISDSMRFEAWFENIHPEDLPRIVAANQRAWEKGESYDQIVRVYHPQKKRWIWLHTLSTPVFNAEGKHTHFNGLIVDISEQKQAEEALQRQLVFGNIITTISTNFINLDFNEIDAGINQALEVLGVFAGVDRSYVLLFQRESQNLNNSYVWCAPGIEPQRHRMQGMLLEGMPWFFQKVRDLEVVHAPRIADLPPEARLDQYKCRQQGILSLILVPMALRGVVIGCVGFDSIRSEKEWSEDYIALLKIVGQIFVNALERRRAHEALRESQQLLAQRIDERTREISTLLELSFNLAATLDLEPQLDLILDQLKAVVEYNGASILKLDGEMLKVVAYRGPIEQEKALRISFPISQAGANRAVIEGREPVIIPDIRGNTLLARAFQETAGKQLDCTFSYLRSWLGVPLIVRDQVIGMLSLDHPQPDYYQAVPHSRLALAFANQVAVAIENARLYGEARRRADEAQTLFAVQQAITSRLDSDAVLQMIANEARRLTHSEQGAVYLLDGDEFVVSVVSGDVDPRMLGYRLPLEGSVAGMALKTGQPILVTDAQSDTRVYADLIRRVGARSFLIVPLMSSTGPIGTITVANKKEGELSPEDERVLVMLASSAVIGLENARLYQEEQKRRRVAEGLRDILAVLNSNRGLSDVLHYIAEQAMLLLGASSTMIRRADFERKIVTTEASCNLPEAFRTIQTSRLNYTDRDQMLMNHKPVVIPDLEASFGPLLETEEALDEGLRIGFAITLKYYRSYLAVPLFIREEIYGSLVFHYADPREFSEEDIRLATTLGDQAALAIENARLRLQAAQSAVANERNRLARDLHDAVTQTLFSASLIAEVLPILWERRPEEGQRRLEELRQLTRGALAEMRTLLLELRPSSLVEAEVDELFRHLADAFTGRARVPVHLNVEGNSTLPPDVKVALYRIAQEALNNIAKHAGASQVFMEIHFSSSYNGSENRKVSLIIRDDGCGFDPTAELIEHLGVGIMKERAENIGAQLEISSEIGKGSQVSVVWKAAKGEDLV